MMATQFVQKPHLKFVSSLDCEGDGHFEEPLVTISHVHDNSARAASNESIPGDGGAGFHCFPANSISCGKLLPFFVCDDATVLYDMEVKPWHSLALERWPLM